jgi:hypothetical protein
MARLYGKKRIPIASAKQLSLLKMAFCYSVKKAQLEYLSEVFFAQLQPFSG